MIALMVDIARAHDKTIVYNFRSDPTYCPYCLRCPGLLRMEAVEPLLWRHSCGAVHDERQAIVNEGRV